MPGFKPAVKKSGKASGKAAAKPGHTAPSKPGGCGTGAGGFQAGNTCGHKGNRNHKVEAARAAHGQAKADVLKHVKAHRKVTKAAAKAGEAAPAPKDLHAAIKKAAAAHGELKAARDTHRAEQRDRRNAAAKERRAVKAGRAEPLSARPVNPSLRDRADKHRSGKGSTPDRAKRLLDHLSAREAEHRKSHQGLMERVKEHKDYARSIHESNPGGKAFTPRDKRDVAEAETNARAAKAAAGEHKSAADRIKQRIKTVKKLTEKSRGKSAPVVNQGGSSTPPHTGLTSSQARPSATDRPSRNDRLAVLAARHDIAAKRLAEHRDESARHAYTRQTLAGRGNNNPESATERGRYADSHAIGRRAQIHKETAERLRESIHDPAKSGAAARTLKSLGNNPVGSRANVDAIRATAGKLTHAEMKAAATGAGLDHGGSRNRYELRDHLLRTVGKAKEPVVPKREAGRGTSERSSEAGRLKELKAAHIKANSDYDRSAASIPAHPGPRTKATGSKADYEARLEAHNRASKEHERLRRVRNEAGIAYRAAGDHARTVRARAQENRNSARKYRSLDDRLR